MVEKLEVQKDFELAVQMAGWKGKMRVVPTAALLELRWDVWKVCWMVAVSGSTTAA